MFSPKFILPRLNDVFTRTLPRLNAVVRRGAVLIEVVERHAVRVVSASAPDVEVVVADVGR